MALKPFNTVGGLSVGPNIGNVLVDTNAGDSNVANYKLNSTGYGNVTLGAVGNLHITGGNSNAATATAIIDGTGAITGFTITAAGDGYDFPPRVVITGSNTDTAHVTALINGNGTVTGFTISDGGSGYFSGANVMIATPTTKYLKTNGTTNANLAWSEVPVSNVIVAGDDTEVQYNDDGMLGASNAFTFNDTTNTLSTRNLVVSNGTATITSNNGSTIRGVTIQGSTDAAFTANYTITLPTTDGSNLQFLQTDGNGVTTWADAFKLVNGNSNVFVDANANIRISANGNANIVTINGTGDANTQGITVNGIVNALALANGNSNVSVSANSDVVTSANGNVVVTVTSSGDGNLRTTGANFDGYVSATGNIIAPNFNGALSNANSSVAIPTANGNVITTANSNVVVTVTSSGDGNRQTTGANVDGYVWANGNIITTANFVGVLANGISNVRIAANGNVGITANGTGNILTVVGGADANTTGANVAGYVTVSGNVTGANFVGPLANGNSRVSIAANANVVTTANGNVVVTVTSSGDGNIQTTGGNVAGYWNVSGNVIAGNLVGPLANGNSNIRIFANSNLTFSSNGVANTVVLTASDNGNIQTTGATVTGYITASGNVTAPYFIGTLANSNSNVAIATANGDVTISSNNQSNIIIVTSNGTAANTTINGGLTVTGNLQVTGNTIYANIETLVVEDPIIQLGTGENAAVLTSNDGKDRGLELHTYGDGNAYTANGAVVSGSTIIPIADTRGITAGQLVTTLTGAIPPGTEVQTITTNTSITISAATTANISNGDELQIGNDTLRFIGWDASSNEFAFGSNVVITNEVVTFANLGNVRASYFLGNLTGVFANGNSNVRIAANGNVTISANGNSNIVTFTSSGDGNLQTTGVGVLGYVSATGNIIAPNFNGALSNANSSVAIPAANGNVITTANTVAVVTVTSDGVGSNLELTGVNVAGYVTATGNVTAPNLVGRLANGNSSIAITSNANVVTSANGNVVVTVTSSGDGNLETTGGNVAGYWRATGNIIAPNFNGVLSNGTSNVRIGTANGAVSTASNGNVVVIVTSSGDGNLQTTGANVLGYVSATGNIIAPNFNGVLSNGNSNVRIATSNGNVTISAVGNANIVTVTGTGANVTGTLNVSNVATLGSSLQFGVAATPTANVGAFALTTNSTTPDQAIGKVAYSVGRVVEFFVKAADDTGGIYQSQTFVAIVDGANNVDYTNYGIVGNSAGAISVALTDSNANITLQVTPASSNSTVFTTIYRIL